MKKTKIVVVGKPAQNIVKEALGEGFKFENDKTGLELIADERHHQINKHDFTGIHHANHPEWYDKYQLQEAAHSLLAVELYAEAEVYDQVPEGWDKEWWIKLCNKPREERLVIAGSFCAAEIDRLNCLKIWNNEK